MLLKFLIFLRLIYNETNINLWCYNFSNPKDITTIKLVKSANYILKITN